MGVVGGRFEQTYQESKGQVFIEEVGNPVVNKFVGVGFERVTTARKWLQVKPPGAVVGALSAPVLPDLRLILNLFIHKRVLINERSRCQNTSFESLQMIKEANRYFGLGLLVFFGDLLVFESLSCWEYHFFCVRLKEEIGDRLCLVVLPTLLLTAHRRFLLVL